MWCGAAEKKEEAQEAHQHTQNMSKDENCRQLYPDELGIYHRGEAYKKKKKDMLEAYESRQHPPTHPKPQKAFVLGNHNWSCSESRLAPGDLVMR